MLDVKGIVLTSLVAEGLNALLLVVRDSEVAIPIPEDVTSGDVDKRLVGNENVMIGDDVETGRLVVRHEHAEEILNGEPEHSEA